MSCQEESQRTRLAEKLRKVDTQLRTEMLARGFDPSQDDNVALTAPLAKLYAERENLRTELESLTEHEGSEEKQENAMGEVERIVDQLKRAFEGGAWHGPAVIEILEGITAQQAAAQPLGAVHSIWEIVLHIAAWEGAGARRLRGDRAQLSSEEDWPVVTASSQEAWQQTMKALKQGNEELRSAISRLDESRLNQPILEGMSSVYQTLHGIVQHDLYHAGQIAILKKMISEDSKV
jgi:uncharacterized damage-inducible protein DinB